LRDFLNADGVKRGGKYWDRSVKRIPMNIGVLSLPQSICDTGLLIAKPIVVRNAYVVHVLATDTFDTRWK